MRPRKLTLAAARVNAGLTQLEAADRMGISAATMINWEKGKTQPRVEQAERLSDLYGMTMNEIFFTPEK